MKKFEGRRATEDDLARLPLRTVPANYSDRVMAHIARAGMQRAHWLDTMIGAQIAITGAMAITLSIMFWEEIVPLVDSALVTLNALLVMVEQFAGDMLNLANAIRIEPLEDLEPLEWMLMICFAGIVWLVANGLLIHGLRRERSI